jgi:hypothetical protein
MAYGTAKADTLAYTTPTGEVTSSVSGIAVAAITAGIVDPGTKNISTTGIISGAVYKTSGNVTVISGSGDVRPYGLFSFPASVGTSGYYLVTNGDGTTSWSAFDTSAFISLGKAVAIN